MADSPASASTPSSAAHTGNGQHGGDAATKATKDKACPFCHQPFTSSSLGRHLDLYIRPKNPKPADGVHEVDKIKQLRGGITRRQPRSSLKGRFESDVASERGTPMSTTTSERWNASCLGSVAPAPSDAVQRPLRPERSGEEKDQRMISPVNGRTTDKARVSFNTANWQATGVINNLPLALPDSTGYATVASGPLLPVPAQTLAPGRSRSAGVAGGPGSVAAETESYSKLIEEREVGRAADLALREVLGSLEAARASAAQKPLFEFDFYGMNFPSLCLHILPAPAALFSMTPFPNGDSWPLEPPTVTHYEALQRCIGTRIQQHRPTVLDEEIRKLQIHLQMAWNYWCNSPDKAQTWHMEILRAFARAAQTTRDRDAELGHARQEIEHLRQQYALLSDCQLPRELLLHPPTTMPINTELVRRLDGPDAETRAWDYDRLIGKWRAAVREVRYRGPADRGPAANVDANNHTRPWNANDSKSSWHHSGQMNYTNGDARHHGHDVDAEADADADEDADADADADADGEETPETHARMQSASNLWQQQSSGSPISPNMQHGHGNAMMSDGHKRKGTPLGPTARQKGVKMFHESSRI